MSKNTLEDLVSKMEPYFAKAPQLPVNAKESIVKVMPIIAIIFGILGILTGITGLGILTVFSPFAIMGGVRGYGLGFISALFWLASAVLLFMAYSGVSARKYEGWKLLFYSELASFVGSMVSLSIFSGIIGALIGFYILFQIKSYYK